MLSIDIFLPIRLKNELPAEMKLSPTPAAAELSENGYVAVAISTAFVSPRIPLPCFHPVDASGVKPRDAGGA